MAITVLITPDPFSNLHTPLWHLVESDETAQPDFRYVFDIRVAAVLVARVKIVPGFDDRGRLDVSKVLKSFIQNYYNPAVPPVGISFQTNNNVIEYSIEYSEEYGGTLFPGGLAGTFDYEAWNAYSDDTPGPNPYTAVEPYSLTWMTSRPLPNIEIPRDGHFLLPYMNDPDDDISVLVEDIDDPLTFGSSTMMDVDRLVHFDLNLESINQLLTAPIPTTVRGYKFYIYPFSTDPIGPITVTWMCEPRIAATTIHFMNRFGAFETYYFTGPTRKAVDFERKNYQAVEGMQPSNFTIYPTLTTQYHTKHNWTRKLSSGYVDDATHEWLWQLVASPQVYIELDGYHYPVTIKTQQWTEKRSRFDKMYNLDLEIVMGRDIVSQNR